MTRMQQEKWKALLNTGNEFYKSNNWQEAEYYYELAFVLLLEQCQNEPTSCEALTAWISACHNLSALFEVQHKLPAALRYLLLPHQHCKHILSEHNADETAKSLAIQALTVTFPPIVEFSNNHPHLMGKNQLIKQASKMGADVSIH